MKRFLTFFILIPFTVFFAACSGKSKFVSIGTGGVTGVYYPTGGAIAKIINKKKKTYHIRASVESTAGSVYNINAVLSGDLDFGIAQSDRQYQAVKGLAEWKDKGAQSALRAVCSFHPEIVTLVAATDAKVNNIKQLRGKTVNIGAPGTGQRGNAIDVLSASGINWEKDIHAESLKPSEAPKMLQDERIDAFFYTVGHPSGAITESTAGRRKVKFVPILGMDKLLKKFPFYATATIPVSAYPNAENKADVTSIGVKATLVTASTVPDEIVYAITKEVFDNLEEFKTLHPAFARLTKKSMLEGLSAPLHPGAEKYFKETGIK